MRINIKAEQGVDNSQFGFSNGVVTREVLLPFNVLTQRCVDVNVGIHVYYIDFGKVAIIVKT